jgi:hypothetical protein
MRPYLIALGLLGALIAMILVGHYLYQTNGSVFGESPVKSVSLKGSDLPAGMTQCTTSGRPQGKGGDTLQFGATDVWTAVYADDCNVPPSRRYAFSWVLEFDSETAAVAGYTAFIGSQDCTIAHGCVDWGLGQNFNLNCGAPQGDQSGTVSCLGTWQRKTFMVTFQGIMGSIDEAKRAVVNMDARAQQIPVPSSH